MFNGYIVSYHSITTYVAEGVSYSIDWETFTQNAETSYSVFLTEQAI